MRKSLSDAQLATATYNGVDASCVKLTDHKTVNINHQTLVSIPEVTRQSSDYKTFPLRHVIQRCWATL